MLRTLHGKLSAALLALLVLVGVLNVLVTFFTTRMYVNEVSQKLNWMLADDLAQHLGAKKLLSSDPQVRPKIKAEIKQNMVLNPDIEIYILDPQGNIKDYSAAKGVVQLKSIDLAPVQQFIDQRGPLPILGDDPRHPGRQKIFSAARIPDAKNKAAPDRMRGYIYIILGGDRYDSVNASPERTYIWRLGLWSIIGSLSFVALAGVLLFGYLTRRLRRLTRQMEAFQPAHRSTLSPEADEPLSTPPPDGDEIARMRTVFVKMSQRIESQIAQREQDEARRREAVTNVSHDLRTPLAALQGYLETLLMKEGSFTPEEQRSFLTTAYSHSERLGRLISELFELAKLDSHEMKPALEDFSLAELVQDVVQQHQLEAQKKEIRLEAELPEDLPAVRADIGLMQRALENLLKNAICHCKAQDLIKVTLARVDGHVAVQVQDSGSGIAPEDLPRIFERTYRAPQTASGADSNEDGAGLGLAITQRIVELHKSKIGVTSTLGQGTTFRFELPLAGNKTPFS